MFPHRQGAHHRRSQDFCLCGGHLADATQPVSAVHTFEAVTGSWRSVSAPAVSKSYEWSPRAEKNSKKLGEMNLGRVFVNVVSLKYIGMIYLNVDEMCFINSDEHTQ